MAGLGEAEDEGFLGGGVGSFCGFCGGLQGAFDGTTDEGLEGYEVLEVLGDGPALGGLAEVPLGRG